jgi:hypothetical protein
MPAEGEAMLSPPVARSFAKSPPPFAGRQPAVSPRQRPHLGNQAMLRRLQPKLEIGAADHPLEKEADRAADQVMRMAMAAPPPSVAPIRLSRTCAACEERVQKWSAGTATAEAPTLVHDVLRSPGQPLDAATRAFFGQGFGHDFAGVRIHTDAKAAESARSVGAAAYTVGPDVVFGSGRYAPRDAAGQRLLAHELAHVVQQSAAPSAAHAAGTLSRSPTLLQRLGANPGCTAAQADAIHQGIFNARGWLNKAMPQLAATPLSAAVLGSLRRNFGPTYGVAANAPLIQSRLGAAYHELSTSPFGCATAATEQACRDGHCGVTPVAGGHAANICTDVSLTPGTDPVFLAGCILHEAFHAAFANFTVDEYSGWHGKAAPMPTYPGTGTDPLLNADSYTTLTMDLS